MILLQKFTITVSNFRFYVKFNDVFTNVKTEQELIITFIINPPGIFVKFVQNFFLLEEHTIFDAL